MRQYEVMYILKPDLEEEGTTQLVERISKIITDGGGEIIEFNPWGVKRLAYEIDDYREGYYVVLKCRAAHAVAKELDRVFRITDGVLRHIIIRLDQ
ncbi:MAG: 30S ribosomal protein S6 [Candidatus Desulforudis sp.]|nr:30S ribosomal protein S6 [Desulforudis sp.]